MKQNSYFIDLRNKEQVEWFNKIGSKLAKTVMYTPIVDTATDKPVGYIIKPEGILKNYVIRKASSFIKNAVTAVIDKNGEVH